MNLTVGNITMVSSGKEKGSFPQDRVTQKVEVLIFRTVDRHLILYRHMTSDIFNIYIIHMFVICFYFSHISVV